MFGRDWIQVISATPEMLLCRSSRAASATSSPGNFCKSSLSETEMVCNTSCSWGRFAKLRPLGTKRTGCPSRKDAANVATGLSSSWNNDVRRCRNEVEEVVK